jgi:peptidoglycan/LPS O-acetylase OafA/YrhL
VVRTQALAPGPKRLSGGTRVLAIDILRGFAILWVVLYHLWTDLRYPNVYPLQGDAFRAVPQRFAEGDLAGGATAVSDAFLRVGYLGVPLFMLLSGLSLTIVALQQETAPERPWTLIARRLRRLLIPYWTGFALTLAFAAALALVQWQRHGGGGYWEYLQNGDIRVDGGQLFAGALLVPRIFRNDWQFAPEGSLWFVMVVVQYYLLFPALLVTMKRAGPWLYLVATFAVTLASLEVISAGGGLTGHRSWVEIGAPFRLFEFGTGMTLGYLFVRQRSTLAAIARPSLAGPSVALGAAMFVAACLIAPDSRTLAPLQTPAIVAGLALMCTPLIARRQVMLEASAPGRALAWVGMVSYTVLIVSEPLRSVTHTLSAGRTADGWIMLWALAGFLPLTTILARPLAKLLALIPNESRQLTVEDLIGRADNGLRTASAQEATVASIRKARPD